MTEPTLLAMPELVMDNILAFAGFQGIFPLRKVCTTLRNYIDDKMPDAGFQKFAIFLAGLMTFGFENENKLELRSRIDGSVVVGKSGSWKVSSKLCEDVDYVDQLWKEFEMILKFQSSTLKEIYIKMNSCYEHTCEKLVQVFKSRLRPLSVKTLILDTKEGQEARIVEILRQTDPETLKKLAIRKYEQGGIEGIFEISEISNCEYWKHLEQIHIFGYCVLDEDLTKFGHFSHMNVMFRCIQVERVVELKKILQSSPSNLFLFTLKYIQFAGMDALLSALGVRQVHSTYQLYDYYYFKTENPEKLLAISHKEWVQFELWDTHIVCRDPDVKIYP